MSEAKVKKIKVKFLDCDHPSTHKEEIEHDQLPEQMSIIISEIEVCDVCDEVVDNAGWE